MPLIKTMRPCSLFILQFVLGVGQWFCSVSSYELCSTEPTTDLCPTGNTCCRMPNGLMGCIASDMGKINGTCCLDNRWTGCPVGYHCRSTVDVTNLRREDCLASNPESSHADPLTRVLPRYRLCNADEIAIVHGLPVDLRGAPAEIAYYSNFGPLETIANASSVEMVVIAVHGAARNGDDYFCSAKATVELQHRFSRVLVVAPIFYAVTDYRQKQTFLYWDSKDSDGTWRYGADSAAPITYSSFDVLDHLVQTIRRRFSNLKLLTIAGHSSGGQMVQRWTLLSSVWEFPHDPLLHSVVANPSSYIYLSPLRFINGDWITPTTNKTDEDCPHYNQWEWGLDNGGALTVPYRNQALTNVTAVLSRYKTRKVFYLIGSLDRCNTTGGASTGWCDSHRLETTCMDKLQGRHRFERNSRYVASLRRLGYSSDFHVRVVVPGVGHDHSMMFQSPEGINAIYLGKPPPKRITSKELRR